MFKKLEILDTLGKFALLDTGNGITHVVGINKNYSSICLYKLNKDLLDPNPVNKLKCNSSSTNKYLDIAYEPFTTVITSGNQKNLILFQYEKDNFDYISEAELPKSS